MSRSHTPHYKERSHFPQGHESSEDRFLAVMQESADVFWLLTPSGEMREICSSWHTFTGQREHEYLGRGWLNALHPADQPQIEETVRQAVTSARSAEIECHIRRGGGAYRLVRVRAIPVRTTEGELREIIACGTDITRQELAGQMSEAEVQLALQASGVGMWDWDLVTNQINWTTQGKALLGLSPATPLNYERFLATLYPEDRGPVERFLARAVAEHADYQTEYRTLWPDGSIHWLSDRGHSISDTRGQPIHMVGALINITDLKQAEERIATILASITNSFVQVDQEWRYIYVNRRAEEYAGQSREIMLGQRIWDVSPELVGTPIEEQFREAMARRQVREFEAWHPRWRRWLEIHAYPAQSGLAIYAQDITARKLAEESLRQSRDAFRLLTEAMPHLVLTVSPDGYPEYANQQWYTYTGSSPEQTLEKGSMISLFHPDDQPKVQALWQFSLLTSQPFESEARLREGKTGEYRWFLLRVVPLMKPDGGVWKWLGTCTDIHAKKRTEEALRESEMRFRRLVQANIVGITIVDLDGQIHEANDAFLKLVGYTLGDLAAGRLRWTTMTPPEYQEREAQAMEELLATGAFQPFEKEYVRKDGTHVPVLIGGTLLRRTGSSGLVIVFIVDLTTRKEIERQKDLLLAMASHELKTPLAALRGMLQVTQRRLKRAVVIEHMPPDWRDFYQDLARMLEDAVRQVDVQTRLINDLLDVSRLIAGTLKLSRQRCDLVPVVRQTVEDLRVTAPERVLVLELPEDTTVYVLADRDRISQVITNYVTNALRYSRADQPVQIGLTLQEDMARVWVRDQGPGLTEKAKTQVWQRFHRIESVPVLSGSGQGLGLGLYICQTLIAQHQGEIGVEGAPGEGSTFWFTLPLVT